MLQSQDYVGIASYVSETDADCARAVLCELNENDLRKVCNYIDADRLSLLLPLLDVDSQKIIVSGLREGKLDEVMDNVSVDDTIDIIDNLPASVASKVVEVDEIETLLSSKRFKSLKELLLNMNPVDIAASLESIAPDERVVVYRLLSKDVAADVFVELESDSQKNLIDKLSDKELSQVMDELFIDDAVDLIEEMPANVVKRLLSHSDKDTRDYINEILKYPQNSTGSNNDSGNGFACAEYNDKRGIRQNQKNRNRQRNHLHLLCNRSNEASCRCYDGERDAACRSERQNRGCYERKRHMRTHARRQRGDRKKTVRLRFLAIPGSSMTNQDLSVSLPLTTLWTLSKRRTTEDMSKIAATKPSDKPYLKTSVLTIFKNRLPWLLILMVSATFTGLIINKFEGRLNAISTVLIACVPMLMDTGGNAGSQSSVTIIRALALGEVSTKDVLKVLWKEVRVSLLLGLCLAVACFAKLQLIDNLLFGYSDYTLIRSAIVSMALFIAVFIAKVIGCLLPIGAKAVKLDPAVVASPFITTIVDALSLMVFCGLSVGLLS